MLQQTQVERVKEKYREFLMAFPTVKKLAVAPTSEVIRVWKGLGYNRRALFLQKTAQAVVEKYNGKFPEDLVLLKELPGVGDYTARAILSFAFDKPVAMMDTNHRRFYQRVFFGLDTKKDAFLLEEAEIILPTKKAYDWNQALMDFGSMICTTQRPACEVCPLKKECAAYPGILSAVTEKKKKKTIPFRETDRFFRGRIIDLLREQERVSVGILAQTFGELPAERLERILLQLERDGLILRQKRDIVLP